MSEEKYVPYGLSRGSSLHKEMETLGWSYVSYQPDNWEWEKWQQDRTAGPVALEGDVTWFSDLEKARKELE